MAKNVIVMPPTISIAITNTTLCQSNTETSTLTPFCALAPHCLVPAVSKIQIQITLETIYEEEEEDENEDDDDDDETEQSFETSAPSSPTIS